MRVLEIQGASRHITNSPLSSTDPIQDTAGRAAYQRCHVLKVSLHRAKSSNRMRTKVSKRLRVTRGKIAPVAPAILSGILGYVNRPGILLAAGCLTS